MPIDGLTDQVNFGQSLPEIARIFKGGPRNEKGHAGRDLDYFRVVFHEQYTHLQTAFIERYGEQPKQLAPVMVLGDERTAFDAYMERWRRDDQGNAKLSIRCDKKETSRYWTPQQGVIKDPKPCEFPDCGCKPIGRMRLLLPEFYNDTGVLGYFYFATTSKIDIDTLHGVVQETMILNGGTLQDMSFNLWREPRTIPFPDQDGNMRETVRAMVKLTRTDRADQILKPRIQSLMMPELPPSIDYETGEIQETNGVDWVGFYDDLTEATASLFADPDEQGVIFDQLREVMPHTVYEDTGPPSQEDGVSMIATLLEVSGIMSQPRKPLFKAAKTTKDFYLTAEKLDIEADAVHNLFAAICDYEIVGLDDFRGGKETAHAILLAHSTITYANTVAEFGSRRAACVEVISGLTMLKEDPA